MSEDAPNPPPGTLAKDARVEWRGYSWRLVFHPEIRLDTKRGHDFATTLSEVFVPTNSSFVGSAWQFVLPQGDNPNCFMSVVVESNSLQFHVSHPMYGKEWYETKLTMLMDRFRTFAKPDVLLQSSTVVHGLLGVNGDARNYLFHNVLNIDQSRVLKFERPIHLTGLRFFFPAFRAVSPPEADPKKGKKKKKPSVVQETNWQVNLRVESLLEDTTKLFVQADADWGGPNKWDDQAEGRVLEQIDKVCGFVENNALAFLQHLPEQGE